MSFSLSRSSAITIAAVAAISSGVFGLIAFVIRSDFIQRGCHQIPSEEWVYTANCIDAYRVGIFAGGVAGVSIAVFGCALWRLRHV